MKLLYTLIISALLTGCSSLKPGQSAIAGVPKAEAVKTTALENTGANKPKILTPIHVDTLPPLSSSELEMKIAGMKIPTLETEPPKLSNSPKLLEPPKLPASPVPSAAVKTLKVGSRGAAVLALEKQLNGLRYDTGAVDGVYDKQTRQAVLAFQKYQQLPRTGTATQHTQQALSEATLPVGRHTDLGLPRVEVDITRQILLFFDEKGLNRVIPVSTGSDKQYCEKSKKSKKKVCGEASTPRGRFSVQSRIPGWRESDLGQLYNPLYFKDGFAIHGAPSVPNYNASHGCVRIPIASSVWFYKAVKNGTPVIVFD
jgi:peptidoglycan hydrolase-like protein with peptidoglycan-binding domain